jgi:hypothetical protein
MNVTEAQNPEDLINRILIAATDIRGGEPRQFIRSRDPVDVACTLEDVTFNSFSG